MHKVAVVGCGHWGKNLIRNFYELGALAMVCEVSSDARDLSRHIAPETKVVGSFEEVLSTDVQAVVIATPAETHSSLAIQAMNAGKDVFVEKPMALNCKQGQEMLKTAVDSKRVLMVGHVLEYHPAIIRLRDLVASGHLGKVRYIYSNRLNLGRVRREENILWSFAPHDIAIMLRILGGMPFEIVACGGSYIQPNIADVTITHFLFDNGVRGHIYVSWLHPFKEHRLVVVGSKKMVSYDDVAKRLTLYDQRVEIENDQPVPTTGEKEAIEFAEDEPLRLECQAFLAALESRQVPLTDGLSGLRVLKVLEAAQRSLITNGSSVVLPVEISA